MQDTAPRPSADAAFGLEGSTAIVTGAAQGIGLGIARRLQALGVAVSGWDLRAEFEDPAPFAERRQADVADERSVQTAFAATLDAFGRVDIMVNNAGVNGPTKPLAEYSLDEWNRVLAVDLTGVFLGCRAVIPHMRERRYGRIVNVASIAGKEGNPGASPYGAAKAGVLGLTKGLARELCDVGVTVNCVTPALTETALLDGLDPGYLADRRAWIPMGRLCTVEEIADMVAWVASPRCSFTTGACFDVSGGRATY
ncbi:MAG: SDR family NAD(P)-dependent oxidoreductase [Rhodospirillales bacterium]|nr:SDR family NAD(P)-dependent oxidoreductase [Rhodospirillales bacterium]